MPFLNLFSITTKVFSSSVLSKDVTVKVAAEDIVQSEKITSVPVSIINTEYIKEQGTKPNVLACWLLKHPKGKHWMRMIYTIRSAFQLRKSSFDETPKKEFWQAGKSVAGIDEIEPAADIVKRFNNALLKQ